MEIYDNHFHMDPKGKGTEAVKEFERSGGTAMMVVSKPYLPINNGKDFLKEYEILLSLVKEAREKTAVKLFVALGVHPCRINDFKDLEMAKEIMKEGIDIAIRLVEGGKASAIGEIGRPHYEVDDETWKASNEIMLYTMRRAKEADCAVIVHSKSSEKTYEEIAEIADRAGIDKRRVIKHFSPIVNETFGLTPSVIATFENAKNAFENMREFMLESDYIDDLKRPGAAIGPKALPRTVRRLSDVDEERMFRVMKDLPEQIYGISMD